MLPGERAFAAVQWTLAQFRRLDIDIPDWPRYFHLKYGQQFDSKTFKGDTGCYRVEEDGSMYLIEEMDSENTDGEDTQELPE